MWWCISPTQLAHHPGLSPTRRLFRRRARLRVNSGSVVGSRTQEIAEAIVMASTTKCEMRRPEITPGHRHSRRHSQAATPGKSIVPFLASTLTREAMVIMQRRKGSPILVAVRSPAASVNEFLRPLRTNLEQRAQRPCGPDGSSADHCDRPVRTVQGRST